jgi:hypothetical protein
LRKAGSRKYGRALRRDLRRLESSSLRIRLLVLSLTLVDNLVKTLCKILKRGFLKFALAGSRLWKETFWLVLGR